MLQIRRAVAADASALSVMLTETWHENFDQELGPDVVSDICERTYAVDKLTEQFHDAGHLALIAKSDEKIVGHALGHVAADRLFVDRLYVHPEAQRSGVGTRLYQALLDDLPPSHCIRLEVIRSNTKARAFYARQGFGIVAEMNECLGAQNVPSLVMEKTTGTNA